MQASPTEFRLRYLLHALVYTLAFWAPWNMLLHADPNGASAHLWGFLSALLAESGLLNITSAFNLLLALALLFAFAGAALRTWGSAYLGADIVQDGSMHTAVVQAGVVQAGIIPDGPYRHLRNPLYLGTFLHTFALALLMPRTGAIFAILVIGFMQIRLILGEEAFLTAKLGPSYLAYKALVPRLWPSLRPRTAPAGRPARWPQAFLGEIYMWGVALSFAFAGWRYNASLLIQCIIVSLGLSLVLRALIPKATP